MSNATQELPYPELADCPEILRDDEALSIYIDSRQLGSPHRFAKMCALRDPPGTKGTDKAFLQGRHSGAQFDGMKKSDAEYILAQARKAGINPTGKTYQSGLGKYNDPLAWVTGVGDVKRACEAKAMECHGAVEYVPPAPIAPPKRVKLAKDIVDRIERDEREADPGLDERVRKNPKKRRELREKITDKHAYKAGD
jgi:hypothetical protein